MTQAPFALDTYLPFRLFVASSSVSSLLASACDVLYGMKTAEWRILAVLSEDGPATQLALGRRICMDKVSVSRAVQVLEKRKLIRRSIAVNDARSHLVELTDMGNAHVVELIRAARSYEAALVADLAPDEVETLKKMLMRIQMAADSARHPARSELNRALERTSAPMVANF